MVVGTTHYQSGQENNSTAKIQELCIGKRPLPQVAESNPPRPMDVVEEGSLYDGFIFCIPAWIKYGRGLAFLREYQLPKR